MAPTHGHGHAHDHSACAACRLRRASWRSRRDRRYGARDRSGLRHEGRSARRPGIGSSHRRPGSISSAARAASERFAAEPAEYLAPNQDREAEPRRRPARIYTCPMHPEVRQAGPGACPICGMALEPEQVSLDDAPDPELIDMTRRFWIALALAVPVSSLEMGGISGCICCRRVWSNWISLLLATPGGAVGRRAVLRARLALAESQPQSQHVHADRDGHRRGLALQHGGHAGATSVSARLSRHARRGRGVFRGRRGHHGAGAARPGAGIAGARAHLGRDPRTAGPGAENRAAHQRAWRRGCRDRDHRGRRSPAGAARREDPGRRRGHRGTSFVDESMVTGEPMPVAKAAGAQAIGGTVNQSGGLVLRAEKIGRDTMLARIVDLVAKAQRSRAPIQRLADQVAGWFVPAVIWRRCLAFAAWMTFGPEPRFTFRAGRGGYGPDHRLSLRAWAGDADVDHGRRRPRRAVGHPDPRRAGTATAGARRHAGDRQDGHADRGQAEGRRRSSRPRMSRKTRCCGGSQRRARQRASAGAGDPRRGQRTQAGSHRSRRFRPRMPARA